MMSAVFRVTTSTFGLVILLSRLGLANAEPVTVAWDASTEKDLGGYNIYIGEEQGTYTGVVDLGNVTQFTWNNLDAGKTYFFAVTAYDLVGNESDFSNEVSAIAGSTGGETPGETDPPNLITVLVQGETQLDVVFSEILDKASAETSTNYAVNFAGDAPPSVVGAVLDADGKTVHLITTAHQLGQSYTLIVNNVLDLAGNRIATGTAWSYSIPNPNGDSKLPELNNIVVSDAYHLLVVFSEAINSETAVNNANYILDNGVTIVKAGLTSNRSIVTLTTTALQNGLTHRLTVNNIKDLAGNTIVQNSSISFDVDIQQIDTTPPRLLTVVINGATQIDVSFSEPLEKSSAEKRANYKILSDVGNIEVLGAILDDNTTTVHLITGAHIDDRHYTLQVNNIKDRSDNANTVTANTSISYSFDDEGRITPSTSGVLPNTFALYQNYPNPFNPGTLIKFSLDKQRQVELKIYNQVGQLVKKLIAEEMPAGLHSIEWDGTNGDNVRVASGIYVYSLEVKRKERRGDLLVDVSLDRRVKRMTLIR